MAKTNKEGYFCDYSCGFMQSKCQNFFCGGCAAAGMPLQPNTEYPKVIQVHVDNDDRQEIHEE